MSNQIVDFKAYKKQKKHEEFVKRKSMVYLRKFNFNRIRYNKKIEKDGRVWTVNATRNPNDPRNLYFDLYDEDMNLVKIFVITEKEHTFVSNLDYHIWNKIDNRMKGNPVMESGEYFEPDENGIVDERDWANPWLKCNEGRYEVVEPDAYSEYLDTVYASLNQMNRMLQEARNFQK